MESLQGTILEQFREVLGALTIEEIITNKELIKKAELINSLFMSAV